MTPPPTPARIVAELGNPSHWDVARRLIQDRDTRCGDPEFVVAYLERVVAEEPHAHWSTLAEALHQLASGVRGVARAFARIGKAFSAAAKPPTQDDVVLAGPGGTD